MNNLLFLKFIERLEVLDDRKYLFYTITYHISPTLAGIKPASIITLTKANRNLFELWEIHKDSYCRELDVEYYEMRKNNTMINILFFMRQSLIEVLSNADNINFLEHFAYRRGMTLEAMLEHLRERYNNMCPHNDMCPHEIGIFLGIPLEDVRGFILKPETDCLFNGYWRVYSNLEKAKQEFKRYDLIKNRFIKCILRDELQGPLYIKSSTFN